MHDLDVHMTVRWGPDGLNGLCMERCPRPTAVGSHAALLNHDLKHAQEHSTILGSLILEGADPSWVTNIMHQAPGSQAAKAAQEAPSGIHIGPGQANTSQQHSRQADLPWCSTPFIQHLCLFEHSSTTPYLFTGKPEHQAGPNISRLALHLQEEWDHAANAHLGKIIIKPSSNRKAWWRSGTCKTGQPHRWQAIINNRSNGTGCPYQTGRKVCPCNDLAHNHPEVAAEWDWEANGEQTPDTVAASSHTTAAWRCGLFGHRWSTPVFSRTRGNGCPWCACEARRSKTRQPSLSSGAPHLLTEWDWEANASHSCHPDTVNLGSKQKVHWVLHDECKLGLVHRWQATPQQRVVLEAGSPFPSGNAVCACNSLAVQCPEAADLWDYGMNRDLTPHSVTSQCKREVYWKRSDGGQWEQRVDHVVNRVRRHEATMNA